MKRDVQISIIRLICTVAVVSLHIFQQMEKLCAPLRIFTDWLNLGLVMFFCISAFLYSQKEIANVPKWYLHRFSEILIPSALVGVGVLCVFGISGNLDAQKLWGTVLSCLGLQVYAPNAFMFVHLWYITYLLFFYLTLPLIQKINCKQCSEICFWAITVTGVLALQGLTVIAEKFTGITLLSAGILLRFYLPYFVFRRYSISGNEIKLPMGILTALAVPAVAIVALVRYMPGIGIPDTIAELMFVYTQTLVGFVLFYLLYRMFSRAKSYAAALKISDKYSYEVYLTHCLFIGYNTSLIWAASNVTVGIIAALSATAIASFALKTISEILKKPIKAYLK